MISEHGSPCLNTEKCILDNYCIRHYKFCTVVKSYYVYLGCILFQYSFFCHFRVYYEYLIRLGSREIRKSSNKKNETFIYISQRNRNNYFVCNSSFENSEHSFIWRVPLSISISYSFVITMVLRLDGCSFYYTHQR